MKKKKIPNKPRQVAVFLIAVLLAGSAAGLWWSYTAATEQEVEYTAYSYQQEAGFDYRVHLLPSELFEETVLGPGRAYITALTEHIAAELEYSFSGVDEAEISGTYSVTATLTALTAREEQLVWEKDYELLPVQRFTATGNEHSIKKTFTIPLAEYRQFAERVKEETEYTPAELNLVVRCDIDVEAETGGGMITEKLSPTMIIPMRGSTFTVGGTLTDEKEGEITKTRTVPVLQVYNARTAFSVAVPATGIALILLLFLTVPTEKKISPQEQKLSRILNKHKERIVITSGGISSIPESAIAVASFEGLLKLADEVGRPILYPQPRAGKSGEYFFLVYTLELVYVYRAGGSASS